MRDMELRKVLSKGNIIYGVGDGNGAFVGQPIREEIKELSEKIDLLLEHLNLTYEYNRHEGKLVAKTIK